MTEDIPESLMLLKEAVEMLPNGKFELIDTASKFLAKVEVGNETFYPSAAKIPVYPLNNSNSAELANDKAYTNMVLDRAGISRTVGRHFYARAEYDRFSMESIEEAINYAYELGFPVFVKPNRASHGNCADICYEANQLIHLAKRIGEVDYVFHVQKLYDMNEYRVFCLDGEPLFLYERSKPNIEGDGRSSIRALIAEVNSRVQFDTMLIPSRNHQLLKELEDRGYGLEDVLEEGETIQVSAAANIAKGGEIRNLATENFPESVIQLCREAYKELNLRVMGIDYFASGEEAIDPVVIEVNHNPSLKGIASVNRAFGVKIWHRILQEFAP